MPHFAAAVFTVVETNCYITLAERVARRLARAANVQILACPVRLQGFWLSMVWSHRLDTDPPMRGSATRFAKRPGGFANARRPRSRGSGPGVASR